MLALVVVPALALAPGARIGAQAFGARSRRRFRSAQAAKAWSEAMAAASRRAGREQAPPGARRVAQRDPAARAVGASRRRRGPRGRLGPRVVGAAARARDLRAAVARARSATTWRRSSPAPEIAGELVQACRGARRGDRRARAARRTACSRRRARSVRAPAELAGIRVRATGGPLVVETLAALGARPRSDGLRPGAGRRSRRARSTRRTGWRRASSQRACRRPGTSSSCAGARSATRWSSRSGAPSWDGVHRRAAPHRARERRARSPPAPTRRRARTRRAQVLVSLGMGETRLARAGHARHSRGRRQTAREARDRGDRGRLVRGRRARRRGVAGFAARAGAAMTVAIVVADSVTALGEDARGAVLVSGSHGGLVAAQYASAAGVRAAIFNDAGRGLDDAGHRRRAGARRRRDWPAAAVSHASSRIADGRDTLARGIVSFANAHAAALGAAPGMACRDAAECLRAAARADRHAFDRPRHAHRARLRQRVRGRDRRPRFDRRRACERWRGVLVIGSHGALHGGLPSSALPVDAAGAFFHDAGGGRDGAGHTRLPALDARAIPAATVAHTSARIGDARSMWATGTLSRVNAAGAAKGLSIGMRVDDAARAWRALTGASRRSGRAAPRSRRSSAAASA